MSWLAAFMTVISPFLVVLLLVMDLVELGPKQLESATPHGKDRTNHS